MIVVLVAVIYRRIVAFVALFVRVFWRRSYRGRTCLGRSGRRAVYDGLVAGEP